MFLTSLSYLYHPLKSEEFAIQAGKHQTIDITFIDFCIACFRYEGSGLTEIKSNFWIEDRGENAYICSTYQPPQTYKSTGSKIHLHYKPVRDEKISYIGKRVEDIEGFRLQYKISEHSFVKYTTEVKGIDSTDLAGTYFNI
ncbi:uncharacterized protein LOC132733446 [Ruditapes philippinarum]|uniref:uncharacterized protein LOC132733446 n=1 Tax=Ruditapes philippinarum TaxID=129788 RepID=UPI00295A60B5|nr:uncharacterized protein LOC132733446 [Ruditapes philippinarum]